MTRISSRRVASAKKTKKAVKPRLSQKTVKDDILSDYTLAFGNSSNLSDTVRSAIAKSWAAGTKKGHRTGMRNYLKWCEECEVPVHLRFPAHEEILCEYAASWTGKKGSASLPAKINGVRAFHIANGEEWHGWRSLKQVLEGVKKERPRGQKKTRPPVTLGRLQSLVAGLDVADGKDVCVAAIATMAFYGQCRLGELMPDSPNQEKVETANFPKWYDLGEVLSEHGSRSLHLPWTKTKKEEGEDVTICAQRGISNPIAALEHHIAMNDVKENEMLASYVDSKGERKLLSKRAFMDRCNQIWLKGGLPPLTGHSFRIGGTTYFLLKGKKPDVVKVLGRWSSDAFLRYWRQLDQLGLMYIEMM